MKLLLSEKTLIIDIKKQFRIYFPYLRVDFFYTTKEMEKIKASEMVEDNKRIEEVCTQLKADELNFDSSADIKEFEEKIEKQLGIRPRVSRNFEDAWIDDSGSFNYSLEQQNLIGAASVYRHRLNENTMFL